MRGWPSAALEEMLGASSLLSGSRKSGDFSRTFQDVKTICVTTLRGCAFHYTDICTDDIQARACKIAGTLAQSRAGAPTVQVNTGPHQEELGGEKAPVSPKNILEETVKTNNWVKSRPLSACLFNILCDETGSAEKNLS